MRVRHHDRLVIDRRIVQVTRGGWHVHGLLRILKREPLIAQRGFHIHFRRKAIEMGAAGAGVIHIAGTVHRIRSH